MTGAKPLTRQRSDWTHVMEGRFDGIDAKVYARHVHDGSLRAFVADEPAGWHLSISFVNHKGDPTRYPTWDEITHAREQLLPANVAFVMHLPVADEYVAIHPTTFHLHEHPPRGIA
jgi:hypothetical protein